MALIAGGTKAQTNLSSNREKFDFAEQIALLEPDAAKFTTLTMRTNKGTTGATTHRWLDDELQPDEVQIDDSTTYSAGSVTITVDDGNAFAAGDLVMVNASKEIFLVISISTDNLTVDRDYGEAGTPGYVARADSISDDAWLTIIGNAFEQGHPLPSIKNFQEVERTNVVQDLRTPFGVTEIVAATDQYGENDWPYQMRKKGVEHLRNLERQNVQGVAVRSDLSLYSSSNTAPGTAAGIDFYIREYGDSVRQISQTEITQTEFLDALQAMFANGSQNKLLLSSPTLRTAFDFWGISKLNTFVAGTVFGMKINRWESSWGTVSIVTEEILRDPGSDGETSYFIDLDNVKIVTLQGIGQTRLRMLEPYKATGATIKQAEWNTISCLEVRSAGTHGYITGVTSYAA